MENLESIWKALRDDYPDVCLESFEEKGGDFFDGDFNENEKGTGSDNEEERIKLSLTA